MKNIKFSHILYAIGVALLVYAEMTPSDKEGIENGSTSESKTDN